MVYAKFLDGILGKWWVATKFSGTLELSDKPSLEIPWVFMGFSCLGWLRMNMDEQFVLCFNQMMLTPQDGREVVGDGSNGSNGSNGPNGSWRQSELGRLWVWSWDGGHPRFLEQRFSQGLLGSLFPKASGLSVAMLWSWTFLEPGYLYRLYIYIYSIITIIRYYDIIVCAVSSLHP